MSRKPWLDSWGEEMVEFGVACVVGVLWRSGHFLQIMRISDISYELAKQMLKKPSQVFGRSLPMP